MECETIPRVGRRKGVKKLEKFYYMARLVFLEKMAYTKAIWFDMISTTASILVYYFLWKTVFQERNELAGFTMAEMTSYVILSKVLASQFWGGINQTFAGWIYSGAIGSELLRPVSLFVSLFSRRVGEFGFYIIFKAIPLIIVSYFTLGGSGPAGMVNLLLFLLSVLVALVIMFYVEMIVGMWCFYTLFHYPLTYIKRAILELLSGGVVPLFLFPDAVAKVLNFLPFAGLVSIPVNIYLGKYSLREYGIYILIQIFWAAVMCLAAHGFYRHVIKKVVVQGG